MNRKHFLTMFLGLVAIPFAAKAKPPAPDPVVFEYQSYWWMSCCSCGAVIAHSDPTKQTPHAADCPKRPDQMVTIGHRNLHQIMHLIGQETKPEMGQALGGLLT